jgi:dipeptidyl aminopeptidase/acylaminoacyl peptidase
LPARAAAGIVAEMSASRRAFLLQLASAQRRARLAQLERVMGPLPRIPGAISWRADGEWREAGYTRRHVLFQTEPDDFVPAWLLLPDRPHRRRLAALCLHQTTKIGKDEPVGLGGRPSLHYAKELALRGWAVLAPDYPNFGEYRCDPYARGYASATMKGIFNHACALRLLAALPGVHARRIAAVGHSLGGHNALFLAAFEPRVAAVVTSCGFTSFRRYMGGDLRGWSHAGYMPRIAREFGADPARMPFDFTDVFALIAPRPVFVSAPLHDDNFDVTGVRECLDAVRAQFPRERLMAEFPDCGHDFPEPVRRRAWEWLESVL